MPRHAVFYSRMCSSMGRNVKFYCERFGTTCRHDAVTLAKERKLEDDRDGLASMLD